MSLVKGEKQLVKFEYDFAVDGGAISAIALRQEIGVDLVAGMQITDMYVVAENLVTSAGTPTMVIGNTTDADGYFADIFALVSGSGKASLRVGEVAGALLYDDTNDHRILYAPLVAADLDLNLTVGTAALTAGKLAVYVELIRL